MDTSDIPRATRNKISLKETNTRSKFSIEEDEKILRFLNDELCTHNPDAYKMRGNRLWKRAEKKCITEHSAGAMRDRCRRILLPRLDELRISEDLKRQLQQKMSMLSALAEKVPERKQTVSNKRNRKINEEEFDKEQDEVSDESDDAESLHSVKSTSENREIPAAISTTYTAENDQEFSSDAEIKAGIFSMAYDGMFDSLEEMKLFSMKIDTMRRLSKTYDQKFCDILDMANEYGDLTEMEKILKAAKQ